jgi:hypothetical protein
MTFFDAASYEAQLSLAERLSALKARRDMRELRMAQLNAMVGEAKKRIIKQPKAQEFLERLQERCHQKSVGLYEELLSAVVQDVLPGEKNVGLTLKTARGLPSLDIEMVKVGGERESILEGSGGALTNILSAGLRVIALARSGAYPFLVLDEPDCWLKPTLVPQFANVLGQIAKDLGIQMLIISHHDPEAFGGEAAQIRLERRGGVLAAKRQGQVLAAEWDGAISGIKELRLFDFMSHDKTIISLAPGVTCLTGENDIGKSAIVSALRALFYGSGTDTSIAHGKQFFKVEAQFHDDAVVSLERYLKKSPKQRWRYFVPGQAEPVQDSSPKDSAPAWLDHVAKIAKTEDLDIAFANQKSPVFLLDQAPSRRASILAVGRESMHLQRLIAKNKERNMLDARIIRDGESEGASIKRELDAMECLDLCSDNLVSLRNKMELLRDGQRELSDLSLRLSRLSLLASLLDDSGRLLDIQEPALPVLIPIDALFLALTKIQQLTVWAHLSIESTSVSAPIIAQTDALRQALTRLAQAQGVIGLKGVSDLPPPPVIMECGRLSELLAKLAQGAVVAALECSSVALPVPSLLETDKLKDMGRKLSRLSKVVSASTLLLARPSTVAPVLDFMGGLEEKLRSLRVFNEELLCLPVRLDATVQDEKELSQKKLALFDSVGGECPTCGTAMHVESQKHALALKEKSHE